MAGRDTERKVPGPIERPRLVHRCADASVVVLEAPGGFGKSTLAEQLTIETRTTVRVFLTAGDASGARLVARLRDACSAAGLSAAADAASVSGDVDIELEAVAAAMVRTVADGGALIVEDAHVLDTDGLQRLGALCDDIAQAWRMIVTGRSVSIQFAGEVRLSGTDLAFTIDDTAVLLGDEALAASVTLEFSGWPAAIALSVATPARTTPTSTSTSTSTSTRFAAMVDGLLAGLDDRAVALLGHLPVVSDSIGNAVGIAHLVDMAISVGLPLRATGSWWRLPDPIREHVHGRAAIAADDLVAALGVVFAAGDTTLAIDMLLAAGRSADACRMIAEMPYAALDQLDVDETAALVDAMPVDVVAANPRCLTKLARAAEGRVRIELRTRLLERLQRIADVTADPAIARELEAELVFDLNRDSRIDDAEQRGRALLAVTPPEEVVTRARCLHALGRVTAWKGDDRSLVVAAHLLAEAAGAMRAIGNDIGVADAMSTLGFSVLMPRGDFELGVARLREGIDLLRPRSRRRAVLLTFLADGLTLLGRDTDAVDALAEARAIGRAHADERILGYAAWTQAKVVAQRRDVEGTLRWLREAERHPGDWLDHPTGTQFLAEAAEIAAAVGAEQTATDYLARATAQADAQGWPQITAAARGALAARFGDVNIAEALLTGNRDDAYLNATNVWHVSLLVAHARARGGDVDGARHKTAEVIEQLEALGHPEFAMLHEPEIWPSLVRLLEGDTAPIVTVSLLGGFRVEVDGELVALSAGRPAQVVKVLALAARPLPIDELAETLWPDSPPDVGRRRLRNVLARVRAAGPLLGSSDGVVSLAETAVVDSQVFERMAQGAATVPVTQQLQASLDALARYTGELLPADRFEEWTVAPRERMQRRAIRLLTQIANDSAAVGDVPTMTAAAERLVLLDPFDDTVLLRVATVLRDGDRPDDAAMWAARAASIRRELGLPVPADPMELLDTTG